ncbi:uncharacterized protein LOC112094134 [Morus notabilis]|uniref:uncharacterized protein LOC112094134 n=1 Tax=Morus notabilis TaxID=981085 RepID=UPI000CED13EB|nr:uncharacterized protein LOC112094134 [Morus notabilis]
MVKTCGSEDALKKKKKKTMFILVEVCIISAMMVVEIGYPIDIARNVPEDPSLSDQKNFILGGFAGNGCGDPTNSGMGVFGGFDTGPAGFGGGFGGPGGSGIFPGVGGSGGSTGDHFGSFPVLP